MGGIESFTFSLFSELKPFYDVSLIVLKGNRESGNDSDKVFTQNWKRGFTLNPKKIIRLYALLKKSSLIHLHFLNFQVLLIAKFSGCKIIITQHSLIKARKKLGLFETLNYTLIDKLIDFRKIQVLTVSEYARNVLTSEYSFLKGIGVIHNFADQRFFNINRKQTLKKGEIHIMTNGRLVSNKRFLEFIDFIESLKSALHEKIVAKIIGSGPERDNLQKYISERNLMDSIELIPFQSDVLPYLIDSDFCYFPFHKDTFGLSLVEAMAAGIPSFVREDGGGLVEIIEPVQNGYFICKSNAELTEKIVRLFNNHQEYQRIRPAVKERAKDFSRLNVINQYMQLYQ